MQGDLNTPRGDDGHECFFDWNLPALPGLGFPHHSPYHESRDEKYTPAVGPDFYRHYSALDSRNTIKWR